MHIRNQFELDEESASLVAWTAHHRGFAVNRLPVGISPRTGNLQGGGGCRKMVTGYSRCCKFSKSK